MILGLVLLASGCRHRAPVDEVPAADCTVGDADAALPEVHENATGGRYRVVEVVSDQLSPLSVLVGVPDEGARLWEEGAPLLVTAPPAHQVNPRWADNPDNYVPPEFGVVEVQPVYPGWTVQGSTTEGPADGGGARSAAAVAEAARFALGDLETVDGLRLPDLVSGPVCPGRVAMLALSSGAQPGTRALADAPEVAERMAGVGFYEPASLPEFATVETGAIWMDPDDTDDADGNGYPWDDARNRAFESVTCTTAGCDVDRSDVTFTPRVSLADLWDGEDALDVPPGVLFLDRDGDGVFDLGADFSPDVDGNGAIDVDEDAFARPMVDETLSPGELLLVYSPGWSQAAEAALGTDTWPSGIATAAQAEAWWGERAMGPRLGALASALGGSVPVALIYTEVPHGPALATRPDVRLVYDTLREAGADVRYNTTLEVADCLLGDEDVQGWADGPEPGIEVEDLDPYAIPEAVGSVLGQATAVAGLYWEAFGPFDLCR